jgi:mRNA interferase MazF
MTIINSGELWVADIPFTNGASSKKRPVLILWLDGQDAVVTSAQPRTPMDVSLNDWASSGLRVASTVRLARLDCLEQSLLFAKIGQISTVDAEKIKKVWQTYVMQQF